jgi:Suppressor of fused protein (SUFU)
MSNENTDGDWQKTWDARMDGLSRHFGKPADSVYHAVVPFSLGGQADVVAFPGYRGGIGYVTSELTGEEVGQIAGEFESYELMVCTRSEEMKAPEIIARLARYTCDAKLMAGETMDIGGFFGDRSIRAFLFCHPDDAPVCFQLNQRSCGVLLCLGITKVELDLKMKKGSDVLLALLKEKGVFPFTEPNRSSVVSNPWYRLW